MVENPPHPKWARTFGLWLVLGLWLFSSPLAASPFQAYFGPDTEGLGIADALLDFVDRAQTTLDLAFYEIRYDPFVTALIDAKNRGVRVRVLVDDKHFFTFDEVGEKLEGLNPYVARLIEAGIDVREDEGRSTLMHNKFMVGDGRWVWTGSFNATETGAFANRNHAVVAESVEIASLYQIEFEEMYLDRQFGVTSPSNPIQEAMVGDSRVEVLFAPEDEPLDRILATIREARQEVLFLQFAFTSTEISNALIRRKQTVEGFQVRGVFDRLLNRSTGPYSEFSTLSEHGIPVMVQTGLEGKMHHKVFVIDADGEDPKVILGSANASENGLDANDENLWIVHDRELAQTFKAEFEKIYGELSQARAEVLPRGLAISGHRLPDADLVLVSGGERIRQVRLELPSRWEQDRPPTVVVHRHGEEVTQEVGLRQEGQKILILDQAQLEPFGRDSYLVVKFKGLEIPELSGGYTFQIQVRSHPGETWRPLARQPSLLVYPGLDKETLWTLFAQLAKLQKRFDNLERIPSEHHRELEKSLAATYQQVREFILESIQDQDFSIPRMLVRFLQSLTPKTRNSVRRVLGHTGQVLRSLKAAAHQGHLEAKELLQELEELREVDQAPANRSRLARLVRRLN